VLWAAIVIGALVLVVLAWGFVSRRRPRRVAYPLPPMEVAGAERVGRVWTDNGPLRVVDAAAAEAWTGVEGDYDRIVGQQLKLGGVMAAILMPEVDGIRTCSSARSARSGGAQR
jgi:hypothetical protein